MRVLYSSNDLPKIASCEVLAQDFDIRSHYLVLSRVQLVLWRLCAFLQNDIMQIPCTKIHDDVEEVVVLQNLVEMDDVLVADEP